MQNFKELKVWQEGKEFAKEVYALVKLLPREETYALGDQLRRAAVSVPSNIAEGYGRQSDKDYIHFLKFARGSLNEVETQLLLAVDFGYLTEEQIAKALSIITNEARMLTGLINAVAKRLEAQEKGRKRRGKEEYEDESV